MRKAVALTQAQVRMAKEMLWKGREQSRVAAVLGISQATVSRIKKGAIHQNIPWPDGSLGAMPTVSTLQIGAEEWSADSQRLLRMTQEMQDRILDLVNERRALTMLPTIPPMAEVYKEYLLSAEAEGEDGEGDAEFEGLEQARAEEDKRLSIIMNEFTAIIDGELTKDRDADLMHAISTTKAVNPNTPSPPYEGPPRYVVLPWSSIISKDPTNPLVREAVAIADPVRIEAICIVFKQVAQTRESWRSEGVARLVQETEERLRAHPNLIVQIKEASKIGTNDGDSHD